MKNVIICNVMMVVLEYTIIVALLSAFLLLLAYKWGIVEYLQVHGNDIISKMANCQFCLSWWLCVFVSVALLHYTMDCRVLIVPFLATPLCRRLL